MRIFLTGGRGFVGRRLGPQLEAAGHEVLGADPQAPETDVCDPAAIGAALADAAPDGVIHLAAQSSVARSFQDPSESFRVNYQGSLNVLRAVEQLAPAARVLLVGSADQYGGQVLGARPLREDDPLRPRSPYARSKAAAEALGLRAAERGLHVIAIRAFNHTGPGQADHFVAPSFARQTAEIAAGLREPRMQVGNLASLRDFLHVDDVIRAYRVLLESDVAPGVYNIASGQGHTIQQLLDALLDHAGVQPRIEINPAFVRPTDQLIGDATRLRTATGWEPAHDFASIVADLASDWRERVRA